MKIVSPLVRKLTNYYLVIVDHFLPAPGSVIVSSSATPFSITISWDPPEMPNGVMTAYEVSYSAAEDSENITTLNTTDLATTLTVSGLPPETQYTFTVRAYTRVGAGESSTVTVATEVQPGK